MFGIGGSEFVIIALLALFIFGPERLPGAAKSAAKVLRDVRRWTVRARSELTDTLGPEFENFDLADLNPKRFVQKHLLEGLDDLDLDLDGEKEAARRRAAGESGQSGATAASAVDSLGGSSPTGTLSPAATGVDLEEADGSLVRVDTVAVTDSAVAATESQAADGSAANGSGAGGSAANGSGADGSAADGGDPPVRRHPHVDFDAT